MTRPDLKQWASAPASWITSDGETLGETEGLTDGETEGLAEGETLGVADGDALGDAEGETEGLALPAATYS